MYLTGTKSKVPDCPAGPNETGGEEEEEEEEEEEGLFRANAVTVNEEDPERDRATQV